MQLELSERPRLSVVVSLREPWPAANSLLDSLLPQLGTGQVELVLPLSDFRALIPAIAAHSSVVVLEERGASHFELRALGIGRSRGDIVALTEDHCVVANDWCAAILRSHEEFPHAAAIGGVVENGCDRTLADRAGFLAVNGRFRRPLRRGPAARIALQANVSYKRAALPPADASGHCEYLIHRALRRRRAPLVADDRVSVRHVQSLGFWPTCAVHWHNGRACAGLESLGARFWLRTARALRAAITAPIVALSPLAVAISKRRGVAETVVALPAIAVLRLLGVGGQIVGQLFGPGASAERID